MSKKYIITGIILIVIAGVFVFYASGYRIDSSLSINETASLSIFLPKENITVYMDGERRGFSRKGPETINIKGIEPGRHTIIAARNDLVPWSKIIETEYGDKIDLRPFFVKYQNDAVIIPSDAFDYTTRISNTKKTKLPTITEPLISEDGAVSVIVEGGTLTASRVRQSQADYVFCDKECNSPKTIATFESPIRMITFYPQRNDVVIIAINEGIYALELDKREPQNFAPIYIGVAPTFKITSDHTLDVGDSGILLSVTLQ